MSNSVLATLITLLVLCMIALTAFLVVFFFKPTVILLGIIILAGALYGIWRTIYIKLEKYQWSKRSPRSSNGRTVVS